MKADPTLIITAPTKLSSASTMCGLLCWVSGTGKAMTVNLLMGDILLPVSPGKARPKAVVECRYAGVTARGEEVCGWRRVLQGSQIHGYKERWGGECTLDLSVPQPWLMEVNAERTWEGTTPKGGEGLLKTPGRVCRSGLLAPSCLGAVSAITGTAAI